MTFARINVVRLFSRIVRWDWLVPWQPPGLPWYKPVPIDNSGEEPYYVDMGKGHGVHGKGGKAPKGSKGGEHYQPYKGKSAKAKAAKAIQSRQDKRQVKTE